MKLIFFTLFLAILHSSLGASQSTTILYAEDTLEEAYGKIIFASLVFRHGDRTITQTYPNDPHPTSMWKEGIGELTKTGKQHAYQLGQWFQARYNSTLFVDGYQANKLLMQSSDVNRTITSGLLVLAGAYPASEEESWAPEGLKGGLMWQPVPIHAISPEVDNLIGFRAACDRVDFERDLLTNIPELQNFYLKHESDIQYIQQKSGTEFPSGDIYMLFEHLWDLYDTLHIQAMHNLTLPLWTKKVYPEPLKLLGTKRFEVDTYTSELKRLIAGPLLGSIVSDFQRKRDGILTTTAHYYASHDTTVAPLMDLLGIYNKIVPPYSSALLIELRQKHDEYFVSVSYRNSSDVPPYLLQVPGCDDVCTLDQFLKVSNALIPTDWNAECQVTIFTRIMYLDPFDIIIILFVISLVVIFILVLLRVYIERRRRPYHPF